MNYKVINYINNNLDLRDEYYNIFGRNLPQKKCFCPFHPNTDTPAAAVYGNVIHCFVCGRNYGVYDLLKKYAPERIEDVKSSILLDDPVESVRQGPISKVSVDRSLPIFEVIRTILQ